MRRTAPLILVVLLAGCAGDGHAGPPVASPAPLETPAASPAPLEMPTAVRTPVASPAPRATPAPVDTRLAAPAWRFTTARLDGRVALRISPGGRAVARVGPVTEFGSRRVLSVVGRAGGWLRVLVPERPNGATAWIPAAAARLAGTDVALVVDRSARTLTVRRDGRTVDRVTVGVGMTAHPTPLGRYAVTDKILMGGPGTDYGCCALALTGHQPHLPQGWTGLDRLAVHGTNRPETIGTAGSLGCLHAADRDLRRLMRAVPLGAPVFVRA